MSSIVLELQRDALDRAIRPSDLLRKALVVAKKLGIQEFETWISHELNGYPSGADLSPYRLVTGQVRAWNPLRGWIPVMFEDSQQAERLSQRFCASAIAQLESLTSGKTKGVLGMPFPKDLERRLCRGFGFDTEISLHISPSELEGMLDAVRNIVLNWALKLEQDGILGEGLAFTAQERATASRVPSNINNFYGPVGQTNIQQSSPNATQVSVTADIDLQVVAEFLTQLKATSESLRLPHDKTRELEAEISTVDSQLRSPKPKRGIVKESLRSIRTILEGAASTVGADLLIRLGRLLLE